MNIKDIFNEENYEFLRFENVQEKFSNRPDLHAFILLDKILPDTKDIISAAKHDEFFLSIDLDQLNKLITREQVIDLIRCGIRYDEQYHCFCMFA